MTFVFHFPKKEIHFRTHRDIVHMCHMNFGTLEKAKIISTLFKRGSATLTEMKELQLPVPDETWTKATERIFQIFSLKVNESADDAAAMIELHNFDIGHLPAHLYAQHEVWNILIPRMNYRELLNVFKTLHSLNMLKATDPSLKKMSIALGNNNLIKASDVHPMEIYSVLKSYEKNERYNESIKVCTVHSSISFSSVNMVKSQAEFMTVGLVKQQKNIVSPLLNPKCFFF